MTRLSGAALVGLLLAGAGLASAQDYPHAYPRDGAEQLFENHRVIVWEVVWHDGVPQPYHRHRYDMTGVFLRWGPLPAAEGCDPQRGKHRVTRPSRHHDRHEGHVRRPDRYEN